MYARRVRPSRVSFMMCSLRELFMDDTVRNGIIFISYMQSTMVKKRALP